MKPLNWMTSPEDWSKIQTIVSRALATLPDLDAESESLMKSRLGLTMDIIGCHRNGTPLDLDALMNADAFTFAHDIGGIRAHIDRTSGRLMDCFVPRCAL